MTTTIRPDPRQLPLPHTHRWLVSPLATGGSYAATCECGAIRTFPIEPVVRSIGIHPRGSKRP
jgi:hypothetical protein